MFELSPTTAPPIVRTIATKNEGIAELWQAVEDVAQRGSFHPRFGPARRLLAAAQREFRRLFESALEHNPDIQALVVQAAAPDHDENKLARELLAKLIHDENR